MISKRIYVVFVVVLLMVFAMGAHGRVQAPEKLQTRVWNLTAGELGASGEAHAFWASHPQKGEGVYEALYSRVANEAVRAKVGYWWQVDGAKRA